VRASAATTAPARAFRAWCPVDTVECAELRVERETQVRAGHKEETLTAGALALRVEFDHVELEDLCAGREPTVGYELHVQRAERPSAERRTDELSSRAIDEQSAVRQPVEALPLDLALGPSGQRAAAELDE